jgi:hypothetical protein
VYLKFHCGVCALHIGVCSCQRRPTRRSWRDRQARIYRDSAPCFSAFVDIKDGGGCVMSTYVVIDFETNGLPEQKGEKQACLYYLQSYVNEKTRNVVEPLSQKRYTDIINNAYNVPAIRTPFPLPPEWPRLTDSEAFENMFNKTWSIGKTYGDWRDRFFREALRYCCLSLNILESQEGCFLCYADDIGELNKHQSEFKTFDVNNEAHVKAVLETCFGPAVLSCALIVLEDHDGRVDICTYPRFEQSRSQNTSCYYQVYKPDEHHKHSGTAERVHRMSKSWLENEGKDISELFTCLGLLQKNNPEFKFVAHNAPADLTFLKKCIEKRIRFSKYQNILYPDHPGNPKKLRWAERAENLQILLQLIQKKTWICTLQDAKQCVPLTPEEEETRDYSLGSVYETITHKKMPKMHDAQMDVYACATIYCYAKNIPDTSALQGLITKITPAVILSHKAVDFWRYALKADMNPQTLVECKRKREIPAQNFRDFNGWWMCLKMDGFYVRLKRDGDRWRIFTRKGIELHPPRSFLQNLSLTFPEGMELEGEVVFDTDQTCTLEDRKSVEKRIENRYRQFNKLKISSLRSKKDFNAWHKLRIVVFAFPIADKTFKESWKTGVDVMMTTENAPEHIVISRYVTVKNTADAIEIFKGVVQMGLEGLVIRNPDTKYTSEANSDKRNSPIFKMKQKIVTESEQSFEETGTSKRDKDGKIKEEKEYTVTEFRARDQDNPQMCKFSEWRQCNPADAKKNISQKLKFFEKASRFLGWGMNSIGIRHLCLATSQDVTFEVPAVLNGQIQREDSIKGLTIDSEPFQFNLETVYLFIACRIDTIDTIDKKMNIAMIRFVGRTPEDVKRHGVLHAEYKSQDHEKFVECFMKFLQHSPYDNKKFVLVMQDKNVKIAFIEYAWAAMESCENKMKDVEYCRNVLRRLKTKEESQKQQIELVLMEEVKKNVMQKGELLKKNMRKNEYYIDKTNIPWNFDFTAGRISEDKLKYEGPEDGFNALCKKNFNTLNHLLSPNIPDRLFEKLCTIQFQICVRLQELWRMLDHDGITKVAELGPLTQDIELAIIEKMESSGGNQDVTYFNELVLLGHVYRAELKHKALYNSLSEYDKQHEKKGKITLDDFVANFRTAREREASCVNDPKTGNFPYGGNMWHVAWRMSYGFFKHHNLLCTEEEPADFTYTGRKLWKDGTESEAPIASKWPSHTYVRAPEKLNAKKRPTESQESVEPRQQRTGARTKRKLGIDSSSEGEDNEADNSSSHTHDVGISSTSTSNPKNEHASMTLSVSKSTLHPREPPPKKHPKKTQSTDDVRTSPQRQNKQRKEDQEGRTEQRPSAEEWVSRQPVTTPKSESPQGEVSQQTLDWLKRDDEGGKQLKKRTHIDQRLKIETLLSVLKRLVL